MEKATKELVEKYIGCEYEIHEDGSVSVFGDVYIYGRNLYKLPFKFRMVTGDFNCSNNQLTSLEGVPVSVGGDFDCCINRLTSLEGEPVSVGGNFNCSYNRLTSLKWAPKSVGGNFYCSYNHLTSLKWAPKSVGGDFNCSYNRLTSLKWAPKSVGGDFNCSYNRLTSLEGVPVSVGGDFDCCINRLTSLEGGPVSVGGNFNCSRNKLISLEGAPESVDGYFYCFRNRLTSLKGAPESVGGNFDCSNNNLNFSVDDYISRHNLERYEDGFIVYKRVSHDFKTQEGKRNETLWLPGTTVEVPFLNVSNECGEGKFHACFDIKHCDFFRSRKGDRYIKIKVLKEDMHAFPNPEYLEKIAFRKGYVIEETK